MKPSEIKLGGAIISTMIMLGSFSLTLLYVFGYVTAKDSLNGIGSLGVAACCLPIGIIFAVLALWLWSSANHDKLVEQELEGIRLKKAEKGKKILD